MPKKTVRVLAVIFVNDKYCSRGCLYYNYTDYGCRCELFQNNLEFDNERDFGLIRCVECIQAEAEGESE